jgi:hypothetical protein
VQNSNLVVRAGQAALDRALPLVQLRAHAFDHVGVLRGVISSGRVDQFGANVPERLACRPVITLARVGEQQLQAA